MRYVVLDEADKLLDPGSSLAEQLGTLRALLLPDASAADADAEGAAARKRPQVCLVSATLTPELHEAAALWTLRPKRARGAEAPSEAVSASVTQARTAGGGRGSLRTL